jgi:acylphosphatase
MADLALRLTVHGKVQGVLYRDWTVAHARSLGVAGWVRNQQDRTVAAHLEGPEEAVRAMIARLEEGPPEARVERIDEQAVPPAQFAGFERR